MIYHVENQRTNADCSIACVSMFCGVDYETARDLLPWNAELSGATVRDVQRICRKLGFNLFYRRDFKQLNLKDEQGILCVEIEHSRERWDHLVVLVCGVIINTNKTVEKLDDYLRRRPARLISFLQETV